MRGGEASNPGPPQTRMRPRVDVAEDIVASLEHDLTRIDSDEHLVLDGSDGDVVPRLYRRSPAIGIEDVGGIESTALDSAVCVMPMSAPAHSIPTWVESLVGEREDSVKTMLSGVCCHVRPHTQHTHTAHTPAHSTQHTAHSTQHTQRQHTTHHNTRPGLSRTGLSRTGPK